MQVSDPRISIEELLKNIAQSGNAQLLLDFDRAHPDIIPSFVKEWISVKPWKHLYDPIVLLARYSPTTLKLIYRNKLEGGGKITGAVFGKKPDQVPHYYDVYPLDILMYATRTDMMNYDDLEPLTNSVFLGKIAMMPEFGNFREAIKDFITPNMIKCPCGCGHVFSPLTG